MPELKRIFDIIVSTTGLVRLSTLLILVWLIAKLPSPAPAIFAQTLIGRYDRRFTCYKFRTMYAGTPQRATHEVGNDAVTPQGRILRKYKIDELPQLWNVLRGEMSLVGPRPCLPVQKELIAERRRRGVYELRPGITGLAQTQGVDMSDSRKLAERDAEYVRIRSLALDLQLICKTVFQAP